MDRTTLSFVWVPRTNKRTSLFHFGVYATVLLFDKSNRYFWIKKLDSRFHGNDAGEVGLLRYAKGARRIERMNKPSYFIIFLLTCLNLGPNPHTART